MICQKLHTRLTMRSSHIQAITHTVLNCLPTQCMMYEYVDLRNCDTKNNIEKNIIIGID